MPESTDFIPLNPEYILNTCKQLGYHAPLKLHAFDSIDSTNQFLKHISAPPDTPTLCIAETQTAGRGRFDRVWHSPYGRHIYCSIRQILPMSSPHLSALSLVVSLAVVSSIQALGLKTADVYIKWPNDVLWQGKKLSGILIETLNTGLHADVIIGIGLNVNTINTPPWCSLQDISGQSLDRNLVIAHLIVQLQQTIARFLSEGFTVLMPMWMRLDYLYQKSVQIKQHQTLLSGVAQGVTSSGHLIIIDKQQARHELSSGEASLSI